ncbi:hypothetical protein [Haladaptatus sp. NG-SE-30]
MKQFDIEVSKSKLAQLYALSSRMVSRKVDTMSSQEQYTESQRTDLRSPERNHYFHGKLMTARDMETEQLYHRNRLHDVSKSILGEGLVCGLATNIKSKSNRLEATIKPGLALDDHGRLITVTGKESVVVKNRSTNEPTLPEDDPIYLFLEYEECHTELVPVPGSENACQEDCCHNRIVEKFKVTYTEDEPQEDKDVPEVEFPSKEECERSDYSALETMARAYYDEYSAECKRSDDSSLFLGRYEKRGKDGLWELVDDPYYGSPLVYTNDMLYAIIAQHVTDFDNPHEVEALKTVNNVGTEKGNVDIVSPRGTISVDAKTDPDRVVLEASDKIARQEKLEELEELEDKVDQQNDRIKELEEKLDDLCDRFDEGEIEEKGGEYEQSDESSDQ